MYYTEQDFKEGCSFNYWMGAGAGAVGTVGCLFFLAWVFGII